MDVPDERALGIPMTQQEAVVRRRRDAARHAALVYRRMTAADMDEDAAMLDREFERIFGVDCVDQRTDAMQNEPDDAPEAVDQEEARSETRSETLSEMERRGDFG